MKRQVLYSIVVPIYGVEKYLHKCVDSLINQTYKNIEIILVDDGARDGSPQICDYYAGVDKRIKVIHKPNGGLVSARKAGAEMSTGEYILCVDGDDWVSLEYIEQINVIVAKFEPDIVCCGYIQSDENTDDNHSFDLKSGYYDAQRIKTHITPIAIEGEDGAIFPPQLWAKAFKRELYLPEQLSVNEGIKIGEDGAVVKPALTKASSLYILDKCLYYYRVNNQSMTKNKSSYDWNGPRYIYKHLTERIDLTKSDFEAQIIRRTTRDIYTVTFSQFNKKEKYSNIKRDIKQQLSTPDYRDILGKCRYTGFKHRLELFLLKQQIILPIYIFHKLQ